jgi:hypothetical protein
MEAQATIDATQILLAPAHDIANHVDSVVARVGTHVVAQRLGGPAEAAAEVEDAVGGREARVVDQSPRLRATDLQVIAAADPGQEVGRNAVGVGG